MPGVNEQHHSSERVGSRDGFEEEVQPGLEEVEKELSAQVDSMNVAGNEQVATSYPRPRENEGKPIVQFPEDEEQVMEVKATDTTVSLVGCAAGHVGDGSQTIRDGRNLNLNLHPNIVQQMVQNQRASSEPRSSDMIPPIRNLSYVSASLSSVADTIMVNAESVLGKRMAEEKEVQGKELDLTLTLNRPGQQSGQYKKGRKNQSRREQDLERQAAAAAKGGVAELQAATGPGASGQLARPNVWSRQGQ